MRILVCDDQPGKCEDIAAEIREARPDAEVTTLSGRGDGDVDGALEGELKALFKRVGQFIPPRLSPAPAEASLFDETDVVFLDNNLSYLNIHGARLTAESIAGYIRAFTTAGYLVSLNKNPDVDFDLRHLVGDRSTRADLALNTGHLSNGALWGKSAPEDGFAPWYWPVLDDAAARRRAQIAFVAEHFDEPALAALAFDGDAEDRLSRRAIGRIQGDGKDDPAAVTFRDVFLSAARSIPDRSDRAALATAVDEGKGDRAMLARVVAADLDLWFRSDILGAQDVLVDAPHLAARMPFLVGEGASDLVAYERVAKVDEAGCGFASDLYARHVAATRYPLEIWSPHPVFWWDKLKADDGLAAMYAGDVDWADVVFCEDLSRFSPRVSVRAPSEFVADIETAYERRYVAALRGIKYVPASRFALF